MQVPATENRQVSLGHYRLEPLSGVGGGTLNGRLRECTLVQVRLI